MTIRFASALFALALPLVAQNPAPTPAPAVAEADSLFYKAFYLHAKNDLAGAMDLVQKFLDAAPESKLAPEAAAMQVSMFDKTGKSKERDAFKEKYSKQLAAAPKPAPTSDRPAGDNERGERPQPGAGGGQGRGQGRGGMRALMGNKKVADMTAEEVTALKESLANSSRLVEMTRNGPGGEEAAKKLETNLESLKKALDANKTEDAQKALDALRESMQAMGGGRGRGRGGEGGGGGGNNGGGGGGGGGNNGGGGGGGGGQGGGRGGN